MTEGDKPKRDLNRPIPLSEETMDDKPELAVDPTPTSPQSVISGVSQRFPWEDRFVKAEKIGQGGMGAVYRAWDPKLQRYVAIKVLPIESATDEESYLRFKLEAAAMARLSHPNVLGVYDAEIKQNTTWIVMEYISGKSLSQILESQSYILEEMLMLLEKTARGVFHANQLGIVHRDLKPSNILVTEKGEPKVADFGVAFFADREAELTKAGDTIGTPAYMSPEQADGKVKDIDQRTDVYALGGILYRILTGRPPHVGFNVSALLAGIIDRDPVAPRKINEKVPKDLDAICQKAIEKEKSRRYQTAEAFADDLKRYLIGETVQARPASLLYRTTKRAKRHKLLFGLGAAAAVLLFVSLGIAINSWLQSAELARASQLFGQEAEQIDRILERAYTSPLHNIEAEKAMVSERIQTLANQMEKMGEAAQGVGNYAIGKGYLALQEYTPARKYLERAWAQNYQTPEEANALGLVLGKLFLEEQKKANQLPELEMNARMKELDVEYRQPLVKYLQIGKQDKTQAPEYVEALLAYYEHRYPEAIQKSQQVYQKMPWLYAARKLEGDVYYEQMTESFGDGQIDTAEKQYQQAKEAYARAAGHGQSDPELWMRRCEMERVWIGNTPNKNITSKNANFVKEICNQVSQIDSTRSEIYYDLARLYVVLGTKKLHNGEEVIAEFQEAIDLADQYYHRNQKSLDPARCVFSVYGLVAQYMLTVGKDPGELMPTAKKLMEEMIAQFPNEPNVRMFQYWLLTSIDVDYRILRGQDPSPVYQEAVEIYRRLKAAGAYNSAYDTFLSVGAKPYAAYLVSIGKDPSTEFHFVQNEIRNIHDPFNQLNLSILVYWQGMFLLAEGKDPSGLLADNEAKMRDIQNKIAEWEDLSLMLYYYMGQSAIARAKYQLCFQRENVNNLVATAESHYRNILKINPSTIIGHLGLAKCSYLRAQEKEKNGKWPGDDFIEAHLHIESARRGRLDDHFKYFISQYELDLLEGKIEMLDAISKDKHYINSSNQWGKAWEVFLHAQTHTFVDAEGYLAMAEWHFWQARKFPTDRVESLEHAQKGIEVADQALTRYPDNPRALLLRAGLLLELSKQQTSQGDRSGYVEKAKTDWEKSCTRNPCMAKEFSGLYKSFELKKCWSF